MRPGKVLVLVLVLTKKSYLHHCLFMIFINARLELNEPSNFGGVKNAGWNQTDQFAGLDNAGLKNGGPIRRV